MLQAMGKWVPRPLIPDSSSWRRNRQRAMPFRWQHLTVSMLVCVRLSPSSVLDLIDSLPDGLDTQVGELGDRLSEGERQRIGLARVFLRNADLVLFDEPTSRLDALNEAIILRSIHAMAVGEQHADKERGAAVVLVSHRESAMRIADAVLNL